MEALNLLNEDNYFPKWCFRVFESVYIAGIVYKISIFTALFVIL